MTQPFHNLSFLEIERLRGPGSFQSEPNHPSSLQIQPLRISTKDLVHPNEPPISKLLYGGFLEHVGRCVYGGIVDHPDRERSSPETLLLKQNGGKLGWRKDVLRALKDELGVPLYRWPGGNFVSNYHWQDGIGPMEIRPRRMELAWFSSDPNLFGTDEFIEYCRGADAEPFICLNMGTGTLEEALSWLEYCNGTGNTHWANLRRKNSGVKEPYKVKYWGLGNEVYGPWQVGQRTPSEYAIMAKRWAHALKLVDSSIILISCGDTGFTEWDREVLQGVVGMVDMHSIHMYTMNQWQKESNVPGLEYEKNVFGPSAAENAIQVCNSLIDLANLSRTRLGIPVSKMKISFDEWNVWDEDKAPGLGEGDKSLEQRYDFTDMLAFAAWLHVLLRQHKAIGIGCLAQSVNVIAPIMTTPTSMVYQTIFYPLQIFLKNMHSGYLLALPSMRDVYLGPTFPTWIQQNNLKPSYIDAVAVLAGNGSIKVSVINRHPQADWVADFRFGDFDVESVKTTEMYEEDLKAGNWFDSPEAVKPKVINQSGEEWRGTRTVKKHSWVFFDFKGKSK